MPKTTLIDCCIKKYAYREVSQIYQELEISGEGLSQSQVELMRDKYGINSFSQRRNDTMLRLLRRAFINPFNIILLVLGIISLATDVVLVSNFARNATTAVIIFSMILISGTIRLVQELRAKNASKQLNRLIHESITVRRAGEVKEIPAEELVVEKTFQLEIVACESVSMRAEVYALEYNATCDWPEEIILSTCSSSSYTRLTLRCRIAEVVHH